MLTFTFRRVLISLPVVLGITVLAFLLVRLSPSDPVSMMLSPEQAGNPEFIEAARARLGLDQPLFIQYFSWLWTALQGDLGYSFQNGRAVTQLIGDRLYPTMLLIVASMVIAIIIGLVLGALAAIRQNSWIDYLSSMFAVGALSIPNFFVGLAGIYVFSLTLGWLPPGGMRPRGSDGSLLEVLPYLAMPATILGLTLAGPFVRYVRAGMLEVITQDFLRTAEAKGISRTRIYVRHALRNSLIPLITVIALTIPTVFGGAVVIESVFNWPGMGNLVLTAINARDYPVLVGFMLCVAVLVLLCNLIADLAYAVVDPRIRYQ